MKSGLGYEVRFSSGSRIRAERQRTWFSFVGRSCDGVGDRCLRPASQTTGDDCVDNSVCHFVHRPCGLDDEVGGVAQEGTTHSMSDSTRSRSPCDLPKGSCSASAGAQGSPRLAHSGAP